jgi:Zn-dependent protease with chaperone function
MAFCFISHRFTAYYYLFKRVPVRRTVLGEEKRLESLLSEIVGKSNFEYKINIWISEEMELNAFAIGRRTICITRGMMKKFSDENLRGVLAHELGHLQSKDCIVSSAFVTAGCLSASVYYIYKLLANKIETRSFINFCLLKIFKWISLIILAAILILHFKHLHILPLISVILYILYYEIFLKIFFFLWRAISRFMEYKQDAYAHSLGYGKDLLEALHHLIADEPQAVNLYRNLMEDDHPVIYNRIRRLEKLEGHR